MIAVAALFDNYVPMRRRDRQSNINIKELCQHSSPLWHKQRRIVGQSISQRESLK